MAIDESWDHGQATAVETGGSLGNADLVARTDSDNLGAPYEERHAVSYRTCSIDEPYLLNGDGHDLPSHAIGMSRSLEPGTGSRYPATSNTDFFKGI